MPDVLIPVYESSLDKKLSMASIRPHMLVIDDMFFSYIDSLPNNQRSSNTITLKSNKNDRRFAMSFADG